MDVADAIIERVSAESDSPEMRERAAKLLLDLIAIPTVPHPDVRWMKEREDEAYDVIRQEIADIFGDDLATKNVKPQFHPISPRIIEHPYYTPPHYTKTADRPEGLSVEQAYAGRGNLLAVVPGGDEAAEGRALALNSHIDVVAPFFPGRREGDVVFGRGAGDAKGAVVVHLLVMRLLEAVRRDLGVALNRDLMYQFVTEEEPGGNGSLSIALDEAIKFDCICVGEITDLEMHPANRGAVWYKTELSTTGQSGVNLVEMAASVVLAIEQEGARIKAESDHPLYPTRPVQTNHGILGPYGDHPASVNAEVVLHIQTQSSPADRFVQKLAEIANAAIEDYCARYGDKTQETDESTGLPKVAQHVEIRASAGRLRVTISGKDGHMGALPACDNAITKMAYVVDAMCQRRDELTEAAGGSRVVLALNEEGLASSPQTLVLEGGQGFVPTHDMAEITRRLSEAVERGARRYCESIGAPFDGSMAVMTFDKLHNDSFDRPVEGPAVERAVYASKQAGLWRGEPIVGWDASCDARIFARTRPQCEVLVFGPGTLEHAHSEDEQVRISDVLSAAKMLTIFALSYCGHGTVHRGT